MTKRLRTPPKKAEPCTHCVQLELRTKDLAKQFARMEHFLGLRTSTPRRDPVSMYEDFAAVEYLSTAAPGELSETQIMDWARFFFGLDLSYLSRLQELTLADTTPVLLLAADTLELLAEELPDQRVASYVQTAKRALRETVYLYLRTTHGSVFAERKVGDPRISRHERVLELIQH